MDLNLTFYHLVWAIRLFYVAVFTLMFLLFVFDRSMMNYGKTLENRTRPKSKEDSSKTSETMPTSQSNYPAMVSQLRDITVPKKWFWHFYAFAAPYCGCILFECLTKFVSRTPESASTPLLTFLGTWFATATNRPPPSSISQTPQPLQVILVLSLLQLQTIRRLYESLFIVSGNSSSARLNLGMYLFGWAYYIVAPFALTVDGLGWFTTTGHPVGGSTAIAQVWKDLMSWNYVVGVILYAYAAWRQNVAHRYLASLRSSVVDSVGAKTATEKKKDAKGRRPVYPLPSGGDFRYILFPHYTFEILIYFAFWLITIPPVPEGGNVLGRVTTTPLFLLTMTTIELSISAQCQWEWYWRNHGSVLKDTKVKRLIPYLW